MRVRRLSLAAAVVVLGALAFAAGAQACSCAPIGPREAMRQSDAAVIGRLVEVVPRNRLQADYRYRVQRVYSGEGIRRGRMIAVRSARASAACGLPRRTGRRYGLLLVRGRGRWSGGLCGVLEPRLLESVAARRSNRRSSGSHHCAG